MNINTVSFSKPISIVGGGVGGFAAGALAGAAIGVANGVTGPVNNTPAKASSNGNVYVNGDEFSKYNKVLTTIPLGYERYIKHSGNNNISIDCGYLDLNKNGQLDFNLRKTGSTLSVTVIEPQISLKPLDFHMYVNRQTGNAVVTRDDIGEQKVHRDEWVYETGFLGRSISLKNVNSVEEETLTDYSRRLYPGKPDVNWAIDLIDKKLIIFEGVIKPNQAERKELENMVKGLEKGAAHSNMEDSEDDMRSSDGNSGIEKFNDWIIIGGMKIPVKSDN